MELFLYYCLLERCKVFTLLVSAGLIFYEYWRCELIRVVTREVLWTSSHIIFDDWNRYSSTNSSWNFLPMYFLVNSVVVISDTMIRKVIPFVDIRWILYTAAALLYILITFQTIWINWMRSTTFPNIVHSEILWLPFLEICNVRCRNRDTSFWKIDVMSQSSMFNFVVRRGLSSRRRIHRSYQPLSSGSVLVIIHDIHVQINFVLSAEVFSIFIYISDITKWTRHRYRLHGNLLENLNSLRTHNWKSHSLN